jgi:hypothetical protein
MVPQESIPISNQVEGQLSRSLAPPTPELNPSAKSCRGFRCGQGIRVRVVHLYISLSVALISSILPFYDGLDGDTLRVLGRSAADAGGIWRHPEALTSWDS